jgi:hypothetical protein
MAAALMALHVAPYTEGFAASGMCAPEWLLAGVAVAVDAQTRGPRERLVTGAADISVVILLVGCVRGRREIVVVLPGRSHGRDHGLVLWRGWRRSLVCA